MIAARGWPDREGRIGDVWVAEFAEGQGWPSQARGFAGYLNNQLTVVGGVFPIHQGLAEAWLLPHQRVEQAKLAFVRFVRELMPVLARDLALHRLQCLVTSADDKAIGFAQAVGFGKEFTMKQYGPEREDFDMMVWRHGTENA